MPVRAAAGQPRVAHSRPRPAPLTAAQIAENRARFTRQAERVAAREAAGGGGPSRLELRQQIQRLRRRLKAAEGKARRYLDQLAALRAAARNPGPDRASPALAAAGTGALMHRVWRLEVELREAREMIRLADARADAAGHRLRLLTHGHRAA